jgi:hypothetical protein
VLFPLPDLIKQLLVLLELPPSVEATTVYLVVGKEVMDSQLVPKKMESTLIHQDGKETVVLAPLEFMLSVAPLGVHHQLNMVQTLTAIMAILTCNFSTIKPCN